MKKILIILSISFLVTSVTAKHTQGIPSPNELQIITDSIQNRISLIEKSSSEIVERVERIERTENNYVGMIVSLISVLVALGLLIITARNNIRTRNILETQIEEQKAVNRAQLRPVLHAYRTGWKEKTGLILINYGQGPAAINEIYFERNGTKAKSISELINLKAIDEDIWWDDKWTFTQNEYFLHSQQKEPLYMLTKEQLIKKYRKSEKESERIIKQVRAQRKDIVLVIKYSSLIDYDNQDGGQEYVYEMALDVKKKGNESLTPTTKNVG
ncbi:hypothetical protein [Croceimicrobium sp.]|uniref:hypothetical protein n=1 Tax=Croceimicrobium sp. TaxID=2828340 RepID=UPI003BAC6149